MNIIGSDGTAYLQLNNSLDSFNTSWAPERFKKWYGSDWKTSAAGARIEAPKPPRDWGPKKGCPHPCRLQCLVERRELPQRGPRQSPGRQRIFSATERCWRR